MKATINKGEFLTELEHVLKVMPDNPALAVLNNVLIQAGEDGIQLAATSLDIGLVTFCTARVDEPGSVTLPAKHLVAVLKLLEGDVVMETIGETALKLSAGKYDSKIPTMPASVFPKMPNFKGLEQTTLPSNFKALLRGVQFSIQKKGKKEELKGVLARGASFVATDGHRLAVALAPEGSAPIEPELIIPLKTVNALLGLAPDAVADPQMMQFARGQSHIFFMLEGRMLFSGVVEGKFPAYERVIPTDAAYMAGVPRLMLRDAVARVCVTSPDVTLTFADNVVTVSGRSTDLGESKEFLQAAYEGDETFVILNGEYLLEFLNAAATDQIDMAWKPSAPVLFSAGEAYIYVQMPIIRSK